ncbi:MAG TPA: DinB family protein [Candidatus Limnocylindrales bacterium]
MDDTLLERLATAREGLAATRPAIEREAPWPLAIVFDDSDEARWWPGEVLAHLAEMVPYWLGEIERVLDGVREPVPFGRIATDAIRIGLVERDRSLPPRELYDRIDESLARFDRRWRTLTPTELARRGLHPKRGELTVAQMADPFIVSHLEGHVAQLESILADPTASD